MNPQKNDTPLTPPVPFSTNNGRKNPTLKTLLTVGLSASAFKGKANYQNILETAQKAKGKDLNGYRQDFIEMIKNTQNIVNKK